jgi:hypothetical protein
MNNRQVIKAWNGKIIGSVETDPQGNKVVRDFYGKILGRYIKALDVTRDFRGKMIARGDQSAMLLSLGRNN